MSNGSEDRKREHSHHGRKPGLMRRRLRWWYDSWLYRGYGRLADRFGEWWHPRADGSSGYDGYHGRSRRNLLSRAWGRFRRWFNNAAPVQSWHAAWGRVYEWWRPRSVSSRNSYGYGRSQHNRIGRAWSHLRRWVGRSAPMRAWRYLLIRLYDWWHPVSKHTSSQPGYGYYGHRRLNRLAGAWKEVVRWARHSALARLGAKATNAFYNWWYPLTDDAHAHPAHGYYERRRRGRHTMVLGWVRQRLRHSWIGRVWRKYTIAAWEWWYPEVESSGGGYGYAQYGHRRISRPALAVKKLSRWWRRSWVGRTWRRYSIAFWEWYYPEPDPTSGGYGYGHRRVSRPVRFVRRTMRRFRKTWLGRKLKWLLDDLEKFAFYVGWRFRQDFGWWRIRQWMTRWQTWALLVCLVAATGFGYTYGVPRYHTLMERQYSQQAELWLNKGDLARAMLRARQTLSLNQSNVVANRVFGDVADFYNSPYAMYWRQRTAIFAPTSSNRLALASTALKFEVFPFPLATKALDAIAEDVRATPGYHLVAGAMALKMRNLEEAERHYGEALKLDPNNPAARMSLAVVRLHSKDPKIIADSRTALELLRTDRSIGLLALRSLVAESVDRGDLARAELISKQVLTNTQASSSDRILHLAILRAAKRPEFREFLQETQNRATNSVLAIGEVAAWMNSSGYPQEALDWLKSLPGDAARQGFLPISTADAYMALGAWKDLEDYLLSAPWPGLDHVRFAMLTLARWKQSGGPRQSAAWNRAVRAASVAPGMLNMLAELAAAWGWTAEAEDTIWYAADRFPTQAWPLQTLDQFYTVRRDSAGLRRVYAARLQRDPEDRLARNNYAMVSLLMNLDLANAHKTAEELHTVEPQNPVFASTYAFSLHLQGRTREGLEVLRVLGLEQLDDPSLSLYYGVMLVADGQAETAQPYLKRGAKAFMLPEELALLRYANLRP